MAYGTFKKIYKNCLIKNYEYRLIIKKKNASVNCNCKQHNIS